MFQITVYSQFVNASAKAMEEVLQALKSGGNIPYRNSKVSRILQVSVLVIIYNNMCKM